MVNWHYFSHDYNQNSNSSSALQSAITTVSTDTHGQTSVCPLSFTTEQNIPSLFPSVTILTFHWAELSKGQAMIMFSSKFTVKRTVWSFQVHQRHFYTMINSLFEMSPAGTGIFGSSTVPWLKVSHPVASPATIQEASSAQNSSRNFPPLKDGFTAVLSH